MPAKLSIEYTEQELVELILADINEKIPGFSVSESDIQIQVKSKQNYKSEWEQANFRATVTNFKERTNTITQKYR